MNLNIFTFFIPPMGGNAPGIFNPINLSGTGTTEDVNESKFIPNKNYILTVGSADVVVLFSNSNSTSSVTASTGMLLPAGSMYPFRCVKNETEGYSSEYIHIEAADGSSAYTATVQYVG